MKAQTYLPRLFLIGCLWLMLGCGPVIVATRPAYPPPPWFYPNRVELVRYVYFPELTIYYDLHTSMYVYLEGGIWIRRKVLPPRYRQYNLRRSRYVRIQDYRGEQIDQYHQERKDRGRSNLERKRTRT